MLQVCRRIPQKRTLTLLLVCVFTVVKASNPLATWALLTQTPPPTTTFPDIITGSGRLHITETCTWLQVDEASRMLLVWLEPATWRAETREIAFFSLVGETILLKHGDQISVSGVDVVSEATLVRPPHPSCDAKILHAVYAVLVVEE
ncbi:MAG: hypothetical protein AAF267_15475 [Deinococcota bacterium]